MAIPNPTPTPTPTPAIPTVAPSPTPTPTPVPAFGPTPTPLPTVTPTLGPITPYEGPIFDTHLHLGFSVRKGRFETARALCGYLEGKKVGWAIAFFHVPPTEHPKNGDPKNGSSFDLVQGARSCAVFLLHPLNPAEDKRELFRSFVDGRYSADNLRILLDPHGLFQGVGELSMNLGALARLAYEHPAVNTVFETVNEMGGIVMIHPPDGRSAPPDLHALEPSIRQYSNITFLIHTSKD